MSSHRTILHLPVTFVLPVGTDPAAFAKFLADEAAMGIEKIALADGDIEVAQTSHDPVTDAYAAPSAEAPTAHSEAEAAGWGDCTRPAGFSASIDECTECALDRVHAEYVARETVHHTVRGTFAADCGSLTGRWTTDPAAVTCPDCQARAVPATDNATPDWWCAHHGEMGDDTGPEPWCHGCVEAGITNAPAGYGGQD